jgi:hypothetical protein
LADLGALIRLAAGEARLDLFKVQRPAARASAAIGEPVAWRRSKKLRRHRNSGDYRMPANAEYI